jgi:DNA-binding protein HU-beta
VPRPFWKGHALNKAELIERITDRVGDRRTATNAVEAVVDAITRAVAGGEKVAITGFGVFEKVDRAARTARNPATGATVKLKKTSVPKFRPGQGFKDVVSGAKKVAAAAKATPARATAKAAPAKKATAAKAAPAKKATAAKAPAKAPAKRATAAKAPAKKATATKAPAKRATATKAPAKKATATKSAAGATLAKKVTKAPAKKAAAKTLAKKAPARKAPAKKATR